MKTLSISRNITKELLKNKLAFKELNWNRLMDKKNVLK